MFRDLPCKNIQCDEIWSFCYAKEKNVPQDLKGKFGYGNVWTWTALDADTKFAHSWHIGSRDAVDGIYFMNDLKNRLANRVQLTTDGHKVYLLAVEQVFGSEVAYAQLVKIYGKPHQEEETRYSPTECIATERKIL